MLTLDGMAEYEEEIKRSRFIARAASVSNPEETFAFLDSVREPEASHNCWAFRIGTNYRFSDDGEPKGTSGRPILTAIERQGLDHIMVVVTRYFGGIKLGAGGLTRAYGGVAAACLKEARKKEVHPMITARFEAAFDMVNPVYSLLKRLDVEKLREEYTEKGRAFEIRMEKTVFPDIEKALRDLSRGAIELDILMEDD